MKRTTLLFIIIFSSLTRLCAASDIIPDWMDGSMMPYNFNETESMVAYPDSLQPIHISYIARHGARYLSSEKKVAKIREELIKAVNSDNISAEGEEFLSYITSLTDSTDGRWGLLSEVGIYEQERLGEEMAKRFPKLTEKGKVISISTFVPRVIMTMYQFNHSLERHCQNLEIFTASGKQNDSLLYCFDTFENYRDFRDSGSWTKIYDQFVDNNVSPLPAQRLFRKGYLDRKPDKLKKLTMEMYGILQGNRAAGLTPQAARWFSAEEYFECYRASNLRHYLRNTPNPIDPYCASATSMLIERIIADADNAMTEEGAVISGYFGHCETLLPLLATMNIPGCYVEKPDYDSLEKDWKLQEISPLGANLEIIFLKDRNKGEILVSMRLNGKNIDAWPGAGKIVNWNDLKQYWRKRISVLSRPKAKIL